MCLGSPTPWALSENPTNHASLRNPTLHLSFGPMARSGAAPSIPPYLALGSSDSQSGRWKATERPDQDGRVGGGRMGPEASLTVPPRPRHVQLQGDRLQQEEAEQGSGHGLGQGTGGHAAHPDATLPVQRGIEGAAAAGEPS